MSKRVTAIISGGVLLAVLAWLPRAAPAASGGKVEVRRFEAAHTIGRPGLKVRLTLQTGEAVEYQVDEGNEADLTMRLAEAFLSGHARMYAEVDGAVVRAIQVSGGSSVNVAE